MPKDKEEAVTQPSINLTADQLAEVIKTSMVSTIQELKKPDPETAAKMEEDRQRKLENQRRSIADARAQEEAANARQSMCSHMKPHPYVGRTRIVAPLHSDGFHHPLCLNCNKQFGKFRPGPTTIQMGMSLDDYSGVTAEIIEMWCNRQRLQDENLVAV